ncbi:MAG: alpha-E domain-containing protein [Thermonemataceae bacterium]
MLSRVADTIYWMNRYLERAENYARFLDVNFNLSLEMPQDISAQWKPLVVTTGDWELYESLYEKIEKSTVIFFLGFDENNPNSIFNSLKNVRETARSERPDITKEEWEQVNYLYHLVKEEKLKKRWQKKDPRGFFTEVKKGCQLLYGIFETTISRNDGWHFGRIGQLIERADKTSRVLDVKYHMLLPDAKAVGSPLDLIQWAALLKSVSAYDMYRKRFGKLTVQEIPEFLMLDKVFPRSMLRCLIHAERSLHTITGSPTGYLSDAERQLGLLKAQLEYADINEIFASGLHEYLDNFQAKLNDVSNAIFETFFSTDNIMNSHK